MIQPSYCGLRLVLCSSQFFNGSSLLFNKSVLHEEATEWQILCTFHSALLWRIAGFFSLASTNHCGITWFNASYTVWWWVIRPRDPPLTDLVRHHTFKSDKMATFASKWQSPAHFIVCDKTVSCVRSMYMRHFLKAEESQKKPWKTSPTLTHNPVSAKLSSHRNRALEVGKHSKNSFITAMKSLLRVILICHRGYSNRYFTAG